MNESENKSEIEDENISDDEGKILSKSKMTNCKSKKVSKSTTKPKKSTQRKIKIKNKCN